jgi:hypothetical protein
MAAALRAAGLDVYELPGWETRETHAGFDPQGVVCHHTASGPNWQDGHVAALLRDGRSDLAGPLAQIGLERDGTVVLIAAGRCNHNGYGLWGNDSYGIEAYNDGLGEPWSKEQLKAYRALVRVLCEHHGWGPERVKAHRETDPGRKIDPTGIDMDQFRTETFTEEDDDMFTDADRALAQREADRATKRNVEVQAMLNKILVLLSDGETGTVGRRSKEITLAVRELLTRSAG